MRVEQRDPTVEAVSREAGAARSQARDDHGRKPATSTGYEAIKRLLAAERCVILDGGTSTEVSRHAPPGVRASGEEIWGTSMLLDAPEVVRGVHESFLEAGCDVISTDTWGLDDSLPPGGAVSGRPFHWMDVARRGLATAYEAIERTGRAGEAAIAFSLDGDVRDARRMEFLRLLPRAFDTIRPDLILLETVTLVRSGLTVEAIESLVRTGIPVWVSFRRCRHGVCGVFGEHWGGPEGDEFGRVAKRLQDIGVEALLINCLPPDHVPGMLPWLRDFTDLPLGVYPNLGYYTAEGWGFDQTVDDAAYASLAERWRREGAQIIGGCCGVRPSHIRAAAENVRDQPRANRPPTSLIPASHPHRRAAGVERTGGEETTRERGWLDDAGRSLYPLPLPKLVCEPGVFVPTHGSFLVWKYLFKSGIGSGLRCLDIGCGTGLLAIQLAINGAEHVHAIDIEQRAVSNALSNAFRNGVAETMSGEAVDLYPWVPKEQYDLVVASLYQMPVDPYEDPHGHRPLDYWGRNLADHLFSLLPRLLAEDGVAYVMQLSILSQERTDEILDEVGLQARVADFDFFEFTPAFEQRRNHIERVEGQCDAYHFKFDGEDVMVAYLLEVTRQQSGQPSEEPR